MTTNPIPTTPMMSSQAGEPVPTQAQTSTRLRQVDPLRVLRSYARLLIICAICGAFMGLGTWYAIYKTAPGYTSRVQLQVTAPPESAFDASTNDVEGSAGISEILINNEMHRLKSDSVLRQALDREMVRKTKFYQNFVIGHDAKNQPIVDAVAAQTALQEAIIKVRAIPNSTFFSVSAETSTPDDAPIILDAVVEAYLNSLKHNSYSKDDALRRVMIQERDRLTEELRNHNDMMMRFAKEKDLGGIEDRSSTISIRFSTLSEQSVALQVALMEAESRFQALVQAQEANQFGPTPEETMEIENHPEVSAFSQRLNNLREEREFSVATYGPSHMTVKNLDARIASVEGERSRIMDRKVRELQAFKMENAASVVESLRSRLLSIRGELENASNQMAELASVQQDYRQFENKNELITERIAKISDQLDNMRIVRNRPDSATVQQIGTPSNPELTNPDYLTIIPMVTLLFLGTVVGLVFFKEMMDQRIKSPADLMMMSHIDILGVLPDTSEDPAGQRVVEGVVRKQPTGLIAESYRQIRTALLRRMDRDGHKTLALTGPQAGTGVSCTVQNLASSLALNGRNVLIVDANFRRPSQHKLAGISNDRGLVEVLLGDASSDQAIHSMDGESVSVLPTGNVSEAAPELIETEAFRRLIEELRAQYDVVLIDAPPTLITSDAQMLARTVDSFALVSRAETDTRGMISRMMRQLDGQRASLLGVILNGVRGTHGGYFRRSYQEFYSYHHDQKAESTKA